jgi:hypothetical protein
MEFKKYQLGVSINDSEIKGVGGIIEWGEMDLAILTHQIEESLSHKYFVNIDGLVGRWKEIVDFQYYHTGPHKSSDGFGPYVYKIKLQEH